MTTTVYNFELQTGSGHTPQARCGQRWATRACVQKYISQTPGSHPVAVAVSLSLMARCEHAGCVPATCSLREPGKGPGQCMLQLAVLGGPALAQHMAQQAVQWCPGANCRRLELGSSRRQESQLERHCRHCTFKSTRGRVKYRRTR